MTVCVLAAPNMGQAAEAVGERGRRPQPVCPGEERTASWGTVGPCPSDLRVPGQEGWPRGEMEEMGCGRKASVYRIPTWKGLRRKS